jgi:hypothetical protein
MQNNISNLNFCLSVTLNPLSLAAVVIGIDKIDVASLANCVLPKNPSHQDVEFLLGSPSIALQAVCLANVLIFALK